MLKTTNCPGAETLERMLREELGAEEAAAVGAHVETCRTCECALDRLARAEGGPVGRLLAGLNCPTPVLSVAPLVARMREASSDGRDAPTPEPEVRPEVPGYEILKELGRGGSAVVYQARQRSLNRMVALKMLLALPRGDKKARGRLLQEARALAQLRHPNIVQIHDTGEHGGRPFFSLELVEGPTLAAWAGGTPQPPRTAARLVAAIARAVEYAHQNGILHRDLKPANVLLASDPSAGDPALPEVKVSDFGLAKVTHEPDPQLEPLTASGLFLGTPSYTSPEQARGAGHPVGPAADVYSLGAILYELLAGRPPFRAATPLDTLLQVAHDEPVSVARLQPRLPRDLVTICGKCLEKNPARRYPTAAALAADLRRFLNHEPIRARPVGPVGRAARWAVRRPAIAGLLLALTAVAVAGVALVAAQWREAVAARNRAEALAASEVAALADAREQNAAAVTARRQAERAAAELLLDQSIEQCERGNVAAGLVGLRRGLERVTAAGLDALEPAFRLNIAAWSARHAAPEVSPSLGSSVTSIAFMPDGRRLLVGRWSTNSPAGPVPGQAQLWDTDGWTPASPPLIHGSPVLAVAVSPDGTHLLTGGQDGTVQLWDAKTGNPIGAKLRDLATVHAVAFAPDGRTFAAGGGGAHGANERGEIRIWEAGTGRPAAPVIRQPGLVAAVAYSPDGTGLASGCVLPASASGPVGGQVCLWDPKTGQQVGPTLMHAAAVRTIAFAPDGTHLVTGGENQTVMVWDRATGQRRGLPQVCPYVVLGAAHGPDGRTILTGGGGLDHGGNCAQLWDLYSSRPLGAAMAHPGAVQAVAFKPDGHGFATGCRDGRVRLWKCDHLRPDLELPHFGFAPTVVAYSPDGRWLISAGGVPGPNGGRSRIWDATTGRPVGPELKHPDRVTAATFAPGGDSYTVGCANGAATIHETVSGAPVGAPIAVSDRIHDITYDPDGRTVFLFSPNGPVGQWSAATGQRVVSDREHGPKRPWDKLTGPDGRTAIERGPGGSALIHDLATGRPVGPELDHGGEVIRFAGFAAGGSRVYTVAGRPPFEDRCTVRLWDASTAGLVAVLPHQTAVRAVGCRPGSDLLATGGWEGDVRLWDARTGRAVGPRLPCGGNVHKVVLAPDGYAVAAVGQDRVLRVWRVPPIGSSSRSAALPSPP
ncbi:protein kinase [Gemmata sp. JC717]|uniref:WD40 repeat domain-containing serine/threonine protein kinase n=1 Tax=Gemmata algarum TaxID=2975278 RepID=UPI0021BACB48|nr:protein kinase [Gemmata algarum]MDY3553303.1 protein kinase [Gemmata algarum]